MTKKELVDQLFPFSYYHTIICKDENGERYSIKRIEKDGSFISIIFEDRSSFIEEVTEQI